MNAQQMEAAVADLQATRAGLMVIVAALIQTHPDYRSFQLHLTRLLELTDSANGIWSAALSDGQRLKARDFVEWMQALENLPPEAPAMPGRG